MNFLKTAHIQQGNQAFLGENLLGENLSGKVHLDPETLEFLEKQSVKSGLDFNQLLKMAQDGKDPQALVDTLSSSKKMLKTDLVAHNTSENQVKEFIPKVSEKQVVSTEQVSLKNEPIKEEVRKSIFNINENSKNIDEVVKVDTTPKRKSIFNILGRKDSRAKEMTTQNIKQSTTPVEAQLTKETAALQRSMPVEVTQMPNQSEKSKLLQKLTKNEDLVNLNQFMAKQSGATKKQIQKQAMKNTYQKMPTSMFDKKIEQSLQEVIKKPQNIPTPKTQTLQDIMFGQSNSDSPQVVEGSQENILNMNTSKTEVKLPNKVMNMNEIEQVSSPEQLISKIQNYVIQTKVGNNPEVKMAFTHNELGQIDLNVNKANDIINISISSHQGSGHEFFTKNQNELLRTLSQSGIQVGEFKLEAPVTNTAQNNNFDSNSKNESQFSQFQNQKGEHQSQSGQRDSESRKREELWRSLQDKEVA